MSDLDRTEAGPCLGSSASVRGSSASLPKVRPCAVAVTPDSRIMPLIGYVRQQVAKRNVNINPKDLVTYTTAAQMRGVSRQAISRLVERGKLTAVEIDGHKFLFRDEVKKYEPSIGGRPKQSTKRRN